MNESPEIKIYINDLYASENPINIIQSGRKLTAIEIISIAKLLANDCNLEVVELEFYIK